MTACVNINKVSSHTRELQTDVDNGSTTNLKCTIMTPDSELKSVSACNGDFSYDYNNLGKTKLWITYNNGSNDIAPSDWDGKPSDNTQRTYPQWMYDFDNEQR